MCNTDFCQSTANLKDSSLAVACDANLLAEGCHNLAKGYAAVRKASLAAGRVRSAAGRRPGPGPRVGGAGKAPL